MKVGKAVTLKRLPVDAVATEAFLAEITGDDEKNIRPAPRGGRTLAEVRDAAGHANVSITSTCLHVAVDDDEPLGSLFAFAG